MGANEKPFPQIFTDFEQISADEQPKIICVNLL